MTTPDNDAARRHYWAEQLEAGYELVRRIQSFPVHECCEPFGSLKDEAAAAGVEMLFSDTKLAGTLERVHWIRRGLIPDVIAVGQAMNQRGWILKIEDGYRSLQMQKQLGSKPEIFDAILKKCLWENGGTLPAPDVLFRRGSVLVANVPKVGTHMSGTAIDISVWRRDDGTEVWRGNHYLEMSERTPMRSPFVEPEFTANRLAITEMLEQHGFMHFPFEFWHYNKGDALGHILSHIPGPAKYGPVHWDAASNSVEPIENADQPLRPIPEIQQEILAAVARLNQQQ
jgi:D-alanyl-D-alanine dipeptidase